MTLLLLHAHVYVQLMAVNVVTLVVDTESPIKPENIDNFHDKQELLKKKILEIAKLKTNNNPQV